MYSHIENKVAMLRHSKLLIEDDICMANKTYENNSQGQRSKSNVTNLPPLRAFPVGHIHIKRHRFSTSSFRDFVRTDIQIDTDIQMPPKTIPACNMRASNNLKSVYDTHMHGVRGQRCKNRQTNNDILNGQSRNVAICAYQSSALWCS